jgi:hypothetical protein
MADILRRLFRWRSKDRIPGHLTQYPRSTGRGGKIQVVVGLDFGTAFTKVVIRGPRQAFAVPFGELSHPGNPYLLPDGLSVDAAMRVELGHRPETEYQSELKMKVLERGDWKSNGLFTTAYLALVLRHAREWFLNTQEEAFSNHVLDWFLNTGMPTGHYHDAKLVNFYRHIVHAAWRASLIEGPLDLDSVQGCLQKGIDQAYEQRVGLFPEFAAQIAGYVRSPLREDDLHILMDVGAGTVDLAFFNVHARDGEDVFPIFAKSVQHHGVHFLHKHRMALADQRLAGTVNYREDQTTEELARTLGIGSEKLKIADTQFTNLIRDQIASDAITARDKYPESRKWRAGVSFFLCGGGMHVGPYVSLVDRLIRDRFPCPLSPKKLPRPDDLIAPQVTQGSYDRISVAYGLARDPLDIGVIVTSDQIDGAESLPPTSSICPGCGGSGGGMANSCRLCGGGGWVIDKPST